MSSLGREPKDPGELQSYTLDSDVSSQTPESFFQRSLRWIGDHRYEIAAIPVATIPNILGEILSSQIPPGGVKDPTPARALLTTIGLFIGVATFAYGHYSKEMNSHN